MTTSQPQKGSRWVTEMGCRSYDLPDLDADALLPLAKRIAEAFGFYPMQMPMVGLDGIYLEIVRDDVTLLLAYDVWSGCFLTTRDPATNHLVNEIADFLDQIDTTAVK